MTVITLLQNVLTHVTKSRTSCATFFFNFYFKKTSFIPHKTFSTFKAKFVFLLLKYPQKLFHCSLLLSRELNYKPLQKLRQESPYFLQHNTTESFFTFRNFKSFKQNPFRSTLHSNVQICWKHEQCLFSTRKFSVITFMWKGAFLWIELTAIEAYGGNFHFLPEQNFFIRICESAL